MYGSVFKILNPLWVIKAVNISYCILKTRSLIWKVEYGTVYSCEYKYLLISDPICLFFFKETKVSECFFPEYTSVSKDLLLRDDFKLGYFMWLNGSVCKHKVLFNRSCGSCQVGWVLAEF